MLQIIWIWALLNAVNNDWNPIHVYAPMLLEVFWNRVLTFDRRVFICCKLISATLSDIYFYDCDNNNRYPVLETRTGTQLDSRESGLPISVVILPRKEPALRIDRCKLMHALWFLRGKLQIQVQEVWFLIHRLVHSQTRCLEYKSHFSSRKTSVCLEGTQVAYVLKFMFSESGHEQARVRQIKLSFTLTRYNFKATDCQSGFQINQGTGWSLYLPRL